MPNITQVVIWRLKDEGAFLKVESHAVGEGGLKEIALFINNGIFQLRFWYEGQYEERYFSGDFIFDVYREMP